MTIDCASMKTLYGITVQSRNKHDYGEQCVTAVSVAVSDDKENWVNVDDNRWFDTRCQGHSNTKHNIYFSQPVRARYVKIFPKRWDQYIALRVGVLVYDKRKKWLSPYDIKYRYDNDVLKAKHQDGAAGFVVKALIAYEYLAGMATSLGCILLFLFMLTFDILFTSLMNTA